MFPEKIENNISISKPKSNYFSILSKKIKLKDLDKHKIAEEIINDSDFNFLYWVQLILSASIATLGLLINSISVVIGAMLISPLLMPIKVFAFSITTGSKHIYFKSFRTLLFSIIVSIGVAYLISLIVPFTQLTSEIISRGSPTIVDLFIALASALIAFLSLGFTRLSETIAGVAMASALLPPLCVVGITLQFQNFEIAQGSGLLFFANFIAILIIGVFVLYFFGFTSRNKLDKTRSFTSIILVILTIVLISIPLIKGMKIIATDINLNQSIKNTVNGFIKNNIDDKIEISNIAYKNIDQNKIFVNATLNVPIGTVVTDKHKQEITNILALSTNKSVDLDLRIVDISSVYIDIIKEPTREEKIKNHIYDLFKKKYPDIIIIDLKIAYQKDPIVLLELFSSQSPKESEIIENIEISTKSELKENIVFIFQRQKNQQKTETQFIKEQNIINQEFQKIFTGSRIEKLNIFSENTQTGNYLYNTGKKLNINIVFSTPLKGDINILLSGLKHNIQENIGQEIRLNVEYKTFSNFNL